MKKKNILFKKLLFKKKAKQIFCKYTLICMLFKFNYIKIVISTTINQNSTLFIKIYIYIYDTENALGSFKFRKHY